MARTPWQSRALIVAIVTTGCGGARYDEDVWAQPAEVIVATPGLVIRAEDDSFLLSSAAPIRPPFYSFDCPAEPTPTNFELAERLGAVRVRVRHPSAPEELYGILALCRVHRDWTGPVQRAYEIRIDGVRVTEAFGARVSYTVEPVTTATLRFGSRIVRPPAWILWISDRPL